MECTFCGGGIHFDRGASRLTGFNYAVETDKLLQQFAVIFTAKINDKTFVTKTSLCNQTFKDKQLHMPQLCN